jgi:hypothetical protein
MPCVCGALVSLVQDRTGQDRTAWDSGQQDSGTAGRRDGGTAGHTSKDGGREGRAGRERWGGGLGAAGVAVGGGTGAVHQA